MTDDHHDNSYEDTGEIASVLAHIAYAEWPGPDRELTELLAPITEEQFASLIPF